MPLSKPRLHRVGLWLVVALGVLLIAIWAMGYGPAIARETIEVWIERAGALGPLLIIVLMMVSIVASPIPSAPVALVAGAAYGHVAGAVYVAIGSELGALVAFIIARYIGRDHVERWLGDKAGFGLLGSQNLLMFFPPVDFAYQIRSQSGGIRSHLIAYFSSFILRYRIAKLLLLE